MKKFILLLIYIMIALQLKPQETDNTKYQLILNFGLTDYVEPYIPTLGYQIEGKGRFFIDENWAYTSSLSYTRFKGRDESYNNVFTSYTEDHFTLISLMGGVAFVFGKKIKLYLNPQIGPILFKKPEFEAIYGEQKNQQDFSVLEIQNGEQTIAYSFIYGIGFGGEIKLNERMAISVGTSFFKSRFNFDQDINRLNSMRNPSGRIVYSDTWIYNALNYTLGIVYTVGKN